MAHNLLAILQHSSRRTWTQAIPSAAAHHSNVPVAVLAQAQPYTASVPEPQALPCMAYMRPVHQTVVEVRAAVLAQEEIARAGKVGKHPQLREVYVTAGLVYTLVVRMPLAQREAVTVALGALA